MNNSRYRTANCQSQAETFSDVTIIGSYILTQLNNF
jgi:hypothetical protein